MNEPLRLPPTMPVGEELFRVGGPIDRCSVTLCVYGEDLEPSEVTCILGTEPTDACRKGDIRRMKSCDRIERQGRWLLRSEYQTGELDLNINQVLDLFTNDLTLWQRLTSCFRTDVSCGIQLESWNRGLTLSPETLRRLADRRLPLGFDIYCVEDKD